MAQDEAVDQTSIQRDPVEQLAEEFLDRRRHGESVSVSGVARQHPEVAARIRELFPVLLLMEDLKPGSSCHGGGAGALAPAHAGTLERLGDFRILREIGRGGMGVVYEAEQESLGRRVALKVLPATCVASPTRLRRFLREAQAAARLHHTNIVPVFGVGQQDGIRYYVMQLIPGQGLDQVLAALSLKTSAPKTLVCGEAAPTHRSDQPNAAFSAFEAAEMLLAGPPTPDGASSAPSSGELRAAESAVSVVPGGNRYWRSVARIGVQVADALEYAHRQGTLHRDIKPANLLLDNCGTVWIADFGLAKLGDADDLTRSGDVVGTLRYMAPEQFQGKSDARSDVYSLGLTLYELLTLRPAFGETDRRRLIRQVAHAEPERPRKINPAIPRDLETIVNKAIASSPEHRYRTAGDLASDLKCFLEDRPIRARRATVAGRMCRWCRRNRAVAALAGTALALLLTVAVVASVGYLQTNQALEHAENAWRQAEAERTRTKAEHDRAEANLRLATKAFEDIISKLSSDPIARPPAQDDEEEWPEPAVESVVTDKDAAVLESMLKFYDQFAQQNQADVKLQRETARAYRRVGEIQRRLGQCEKAETAYSHALAAYQRLADAPPGTSDSSLAIATIHNDLGTLFRMNGRLVEARNAHVQAQETLRRQSPQLASQHESRFELARTDALLSTSALFLGSGRGSSSDGRKGPRSGSGRGREATEYNRQAVEILTQLIEEDAKNARYRLAMARSQRDRCLISAYAGRREEAAGARQEAVRILESLVADARSNPEYRYELAETFAMRYARSRGGKAPEGMTEQLRRAVEIGSELVAHYPTVPEYKASLARSHVRSAEIDRSPDTLPVREDHLVKALELERSLTTEFPSVLGYRFSLCRSLHELAEVQSARREPAKARATLEEAIAATKAIQQTSPRLSPSRMMLGAQYALLAKALRELGEPSLAEDAAGKARDLGFPRPSRRTHEMTQP